MILIFSFLMYPIFFIIAYILGEYIYPTRNGAMLFAFLGGFIFSYLYYTIRTKVSQLAERKKEIKNKKKKQLTSLMLVDKKIFESCFPKNALTDNSFNGVNEEKIIEFLRKNNDDIHIYSLNGITDGAKNFLEILRKKYTLHSEDEIINYTEKIIPKIEIKKENFLEKIKKFFLRKEFKIFAIKYGIMLLFLSLITPYKLYYILFGIALFLFGILQKFFKKINQQNQIPYPRF